MQSTLTPVVLHGRRAFAACALAGSLALGLSACGSSGSSAAASPAASAGTSTSSANSRYQARLKAAQCLRAHGLNVPDPSANGGAPGGVGGGGGAGGGGLRQLLTTPAGKTASAACKTEISKAFGFANITPAQRQQFQQAAVKFAQCMRAHNVNIPDPTSNGAGGFGIFRSIPSSERNSPAFKTAFSACSSTLPARPGGGPGGPGGTGPSVGGPGA
ncbi:MAG TPA: hypothetical protein VG294_15895 [Solirubrobacteraceae bacterium]|jgi:hypothetical protein|nr:hypothetical protein [Solirubrobacteraceae bacterium]